jgi:hypothetical protein
VLLLQGRRRAVFLGALSGKEQLPPFPAQTHKCKAFGTGYPTAAQSCIVELPWGVDKEVGRFMTAGCQALRLSSLDMDPQNCLGGAAEHCRSGNSNIVQANLTQWLELLW